MTQIREEVVKVQYSRRKTLLDKTFHKVTKRAKKLTANRDGVRIKQFSDYMACHELTHSVSDIQLFVLTQCD